MTFPKVLDSSFDVENYCQGMRFKFFDCVIEQKFVWPIMLQTGDSSTIQAPRLQYMCSTGPVVWLGDLDPTHGGREETTGLHMKCQRRLLGVRRSDFVTNLGEHWSRRHQRPHRRKAPLPLRPHQETPGRRSSPDGPQCHHRHYVPEPNPAQTGSALEAVHETPGPSNLKLSAAARRVNSGRRRGTARTGWLYDPAPVLENDDDDDDDDINDDDDEDNDDDDDDDGDDADDDDDDDDGDDDDDNAVAICLKLFWGSPPKRQTCKFKRLHCISSKTEIIVLTV